MSAVDAPTEGGATQVTVIRSRSGWVALDLRELWRYRELAYFFVWRDLKVRYKQTLFGAAWAVLQPFAMMVVFTLVFSRIPGVAPEGVPYPVFAFAGLVPWTLFAASLIGASNSLVDSSNLIQKVYFPRLLLPLAASGSYLLDYAISMGVLLLLMALFGVLPGLEIVWLLPLTVLALAAALSVGTWLSAINVRYRDVKYAIPFLVQVWLFATPVAYSAELVPAQWQALYQLNPMVGVVEGTRWALFGTGPAPVVPVVASSLVTLVLLAGGLVYFRRTERTFADVI